MNFNTGVVIFSIETDEGFMATGYASNATDAAVQANIVAVGYKTTE